MRKIILFLLFVTSLTFGQTTDHIKFEYDAAGNQVKRFIIDLEGKNSNQNIKNVDQLTESDLFKTDIYDDVKYYPNPVQEELYVKWDIANSFVVSIELYSMTGQLVKVFSIDKNTNYQTISFINYPTGFYNLLMHYSNGEKRTLKIVKN